MSNDAIGISFIVAGAIYLFWIALERQLRKGLNQREAIYQQLQRIAAKLDRSRSGDDS